MRFPYLMLALGACVLGPAPTRVVADDEDTATTHELVVYTDDSDTSVSRIRAEVYAETGIVAPSTECVIESAESARGRVLSWTIHNCTARRARRLARKVDGDRGVRDSFVNGYSRVRGAPTQIPVVEGDLEPRAVETQTAVSQMTLDAAHAHGTGQGILVAVLDGGFDLTHEMLAGRTHSALWDALDDDIDPEDHGNGVDDDGDDVVDNIRGHGTFVASLVLAGAPDATILPIRVLDDEGWGTPLSLALGVQHAIDNGADVINLSLTINASTPMVRDAVKAALDAGITIVAAAGNGPGWYQDPRIANRAITVGAVDSGDEVTDFTETGSSVHVYAPGTEILGGFVGEQYATWQGTSFSAALVSGASSIVRELSPWRSSRQVRDLFMDTAVTIDVWPEGRGRVDSEAAAGAAVE